MTADASIVDHIERLVEESEGCMTGPMRRPRAALGWRPSAGCHEILGDEPETLGGGDQGPPPSPTSLLASCPARR